MSVFASYCILNPTNGGRTDAAAFLSKIFRGKFIYNLSKFRQNLGEIMIKILANLIRFRQNQTLAYPHKHSTAMWSPPVVVDGPCDALRAGIGMIINLPGHPMSGHGTILTTSNSRTILVG